MPQLSSPFADALKRNRDALNARFVAAKMAGIRVEPSLFLRHLAETVDPIVAGVAREFAERIDPSTIALYELSLDLVGKELVGHGAKYPEIDHAWRTLLPLIPRLVARDPARVAGGITNAVYNLATTKGVRSNQWIETMSRVGPLCESADELLDAGKVAAWTAGMAQYRASALAVARRLRASITASIFGWPRDESPERIAQAIANLSRDPWLGAKQAIDLTGAASATIRPVGRAGDFRGFGGDFLRPPIVRRVSGRLVVTDTSDAWTMFADAFGVVLVREPVAANDVLASEGRGDGNEIDKPSLDAVFAAIGDRSNLYSVASDDLTIAVTMPTSHQVMLLAKTAPPA